MGAPRFVIDGAMAIRNHQAHLDREQSGEKLALNNQANTMFALGTGVPEAQSHNALFGSRHNHGHAAHCSVIQHSARTIMRFPYRTTCQTNTVGGEPISTQQHCHYFI
jgi:hypothetical protein